MASLEQRLARAEAMIRQLQGAVEQVQDAVEVVEGEVPGKVTRGTGSCTFPGGSSASNTTNVAHGLGVAPTAVVVQFKSGGTAGGVMDPIVGSRNASTVGVGFFSTAVPTAGQTVLFDWIAVA